MQGKDVFITIEGHLECIIIFSCCFNFVIELSKVEVMPICHVSSVADDIAPLRLDCPLIRRDGEGGLVQLSSRYPVRQTGLSQGVGSYDLSTVWRDESSSCSGSEVIVVRVHHLIFDILGIIVVLNHSAAATSTATQNLTIIDHDTLGIHHSSLKLGRDTKGAVLTAVIPS